MEAKQCFKRQKINREPRQPYQRDDPHLYTFDDLVITTIGAIGHFKHSITVAPNKHKKVSPIGGEKSEGSRLISSCPQPDPGLLPFPGELRDEIYRHLLSHTYCVKTPALHFSALGNHTCTNRDYNQSFVAPIHPRFEPPPRQHSLLRDGLRMTNTPAPWYRDAQDYDMIRGWEKKYKEDENEALLQRRWNFVQPSKHLSILQVSKATYQEAAAVLYNSSTFFFHLNRPREFQLSALTLDKIQNINIDLDLLRALIRNYSTTDQTSTLETSYILNVRRNEHAVFLNLRTFVAALQGLSNFKRVVIRLMPAYEGWWQDEFYSRYGWADLVSRIPERDVETLIDLDKELEVYLGPSIKEVTRRDFHSMTYHPLNYRTGSRPPHYNLNELVDPPDLVLGLPKHQVLPEHFFDIVEED